jgi:hypothetical protein
MASCTLLCGDIRSPNPACNEAPAGDCRRGCWPWGVTRVSFVNGALRELCVCLSRGHFVSYRASVGLLAGSSGLSIRPGLSCIRMNVWSRMNILHVSLFWLSTLHVKETRPITACTCQSLKSLWEVLHIPCKPSATKTCCIKQIQLQQALPVTSCQIAHWQVSMAR